MPSVRSLVLKDSYRDSIFLMKISSQAGALEGVKLASAMMATDRNKDLFRKSGLMTDVIEAAKQDDLAISLLGEDGASDATLDAAIEAAQALLAGAVSKAKKGENSHAVASLAGALAQDPAINVALISVPGEYAAYEAAKALSAGLNVMLYSDNVSLADERRLKEYAVQRDLLLMGPDCGTAIIGGVPLAFANTVRRGGIGVIGASGTGMQEVTSLIHCLGSGVSQCIGVGGRDLKEEIGGLTTFKALELLAADPETKVITIIAKPPAQSVRAKLCTQIKALSKPVVVFYAGADSYGPEESAGAKAGYTLEETAVLSVKALGGDVASADAMAKVLTPAPEAAPLAQKIPAGRTCLRGVFGGGSLAYEAMHIAAGRIKGAKFANSPLPGIEKLDPVTTSKAHSFLDMGEDEFTVGKPHPMIDPEQKLARMYQELCDPQTAVLLFDAVIGHGSFPDLARAVAATVKKAEEKTKGASKEVVLIASVCGTDDDTPSRSAQAAALAAAGVIVCATNARAATLASDIIALCEEKK